MVQLIYEFLASLLNAAFENLAKVNSNKGNCKVTLFSSPVHLTVNFLGSFGVWGLR